MAEEGLRVYRRMEFEGAIEAQHRKERVGLRKANNCQNEEGQKELKNTASCRSTKWVMAVYLLIQVFVLNYAHHETGISPEIFSVTLPLYSHNGCILRHWYALPETWESRLRAVDGSGTSLHVAHRKCLTRTRPDTTIFLCSPLPLSHHVS